MSNANFNCSNSLSLFTASLIFFNSTIIIHLSNYWFDVQNVSFSYYITYVKFNNDNIIIINIKTLVYIACIFYLSILEIFDLSTVLLFYISKWLFTLFCKTDLKSSFSLVVLIFISLKLSVQYSCFKRELIFFGVNFSCVE